MIDFRYHVISLVAVFLALAVGVVLGSGPLRTALIEEVTNESEQLREQIIAANREIVEEQTEGIIGEEFVGDAADVLIGDALAGKNIAIVRVHSPSTADVNALRDRIVTAGANITANLTIENAWTDGDQSTFRASFAQSVAPSVLGVEATLAPDRLLAHTLAQALAPLVVPDGAADEGTDINVDFPDSSSATDRADVLLDLLKNADLVSGTITGTVDGIVVISGDGPADEDVRAAESATFAQVAGILDEYMDSVVVASGPVTVGDVPTALQSSALLNGRISTVTHATNFYGTFTVVLALARELTGESGHYGYGEELTLYPSN